MNESLIFAALWIFIYCYMILASIDFGAGFYLFYGQNILKRGSLFLPIQEYLSPISELIHIAFILAFALFCGFSSEITLMYQTTLAAPGVLAILLILIKGTFFTAAELSQKKARLRRFCIAGNGITGLFIAPVLSIAMVISEGGFNGRNNWWQFASQLVRNFYFWTVMLIAVVSILYISAIYFILVADTFGKGELSDGMRNFALFWSMPTVLASGLAFLGLENQNPDHFMKTLDNYGLFLLSLLCLLIAVTLVFMKRAYYLSFLSVMMQYFFALMGYTQSHLPYIIYPDIKLSSQSTRLIHSWWFILLAFLLSLAFVILTLFFKFRSIRRRAQFKQLAE
ncbi:MAG: cytochrome d ubiquinol oxidase subunit II [Sporolactobacillus sp.]